MRIFLRPEEARPAPEPAKTDNRKVFGIGTAMWAIALMVIVIMWISSGQLRPIYLAICITGTLIGVIALIDLQRRARPGYRGNK